MKNRTNESYVRLGSGTAYEEDRRDPSRELAASGEIDYLIFDCFSEKTLMQTALRKKRGGIGYDHILEAKLRVVVEDCSKHGIKMIFNGGGADVTAAAERTAEICRDYDLRGVKIAYATGANVFDLVKEIDPIIAETGKPASDLGDELVGGYAYQGAGPIVEGLSRGADIVITERAGDSTQYLGPMMYEFDWPSDDWNRIGKGLGIGHLMECGGQLTGGYYAHPGIKEVPDLHRIGFPIAEVKADGDTVITKLPGTGGMVTEAICKEQLVYEIGDPSDYRHNDGVVDFTGTEFREVGKDRVEVTGTSGHPRPPTVKISLGVVEGYFGVGRISYVGHAAYEKARLAGDVIAKRMPALYGTDPSALRIDLVGVSSLFPWKVDTSVLREVQLRVSGRFKTREEAALVPYEVSTLPCNGPTGVTCARPSEHEYIEEIMGFYTTFLPREHVSWEVHELVS